MAGKSWFLNIRESGAKKASKNIKNLKGNVGGLSSAAKKLAVVFGAGFLGKQVFDIGKGAINTAAQFETLRVRLGNMYGSIERGTQAFDKFNDVAATTPFQLANVVEAGASLKAFGADAEELIKPVADLAAFMGTDVVDAANAMGRAFAGGAGAADVLRDKGILQLIKDSQGIVDLTQLTLPQFRDAMVNALSDPKTGIAGATTKLADTWNGAVSNFQDGVDRLKAAIGDQLIKALRPKLDDINAKLSEMGEVGWDNIGKSLNANFQLLIDGLKIIAGAGGKIIGLKLVEGIQEMIELTFPSVAKTLGSMAGPFAGLIEDMLLEADPTLGESIVQFEGYGEEIKAIMEQLEIDIDAIYDKILADAKTFRDESALIGPPLPPFIEDPDLLTEQIEASKSIYEAHLEQKMGSLNKHAEELKLLGVSEVDREKWKTEQIAIYQKKDLQSRLSAGSKLAGAISSLNQAAKGEAVFTARMQQAQAVVDTYASATAAIAPPPKGYGPTPFGYVAAAAAIISGLANVKQIESSINSFATGGSFITNGPEAIMVGDNPSGREMVNVTPLDDIDEPVAGGSTININLTGNVMSESYTEEIIIPHIKSAIRRGEDVGIG